MIITQSMKINTIGEIFEKKKKVSRLIIIMIDLAYV